MATLIPTSRDDLMAVAQTFSSDKKGLELSIAKMAEKKAEIEAENAKALLLKAIKVIALGKVGTALHTLKKLKAEGKTILSISFSNKTNKYYAIVR